MHHAADSVLPRGGRVSETFRSTSLVEERTIARVKVLYVLLGMAEATILPFMALLLAERGFTPYQLDWNLRC